RHRSRRGRWRFTARSWTDVDLLLGPRRGSLLGASGRLGEQGYATDLAPRDDRVEAAVAQRHHHFQVLGLHQPAHVLGHVRALHVLVVGTLVAFDDAPAVA